MFDLEKGLHEIVQEEGAQGDTATKTVMGKYKKIAMCETSGMPPNKSIIFIVDNGLGITIFGFDVYLA